MLGRHLQKFLLIMLCLLALTLPTRENRSAEIQKSHALSMYGDIKYLPDFTHFDYVNPNAPKGGSVRLAAIGTYNSFNPFIIKGIAATGLSMIYDGLLESSQDEAFTEYARLAKSIEMPEDRSWVIFNLHPEARWHDGMPITADDVIFSFNILMESGNPFYKAYYSEVSKAEKLNTHSVKFSFGQNVNRELPLIMGQFTVLPKHYWKDRDFSETTLEPPLGSGPYKIDSFEPGRSVTYSRVADYWGKALPVNRGRYNFDKIKYDYYRDSTIAVEALKANEYDFRNENIAKNWAGAYDIAAVKEGRLIKELVPHESPTGMQGFFFNLRRSQFTDPLVRRALMFAFDFEWTNDNLFYGQYTRTSSYFSNTELAASGIPEGEELLLLETFRDRIPDALFSESYEVPATDGSGNIRENLLRATALLAEAGWVITDGTLTNSEGTQMSIEFLLVSPAFERVVAPMVQNLQRLGIEGSIRIVDTAQYQNRLDDFDFDIIVVARGQSLSPGNEQRGYWGSDFADTAGSQNFNGIKNPVVDSLIESLVSSPDRESLVTTAKALDRVLLWEHYVIPHWHIRSFRMVYWDIFGKPSISPKYGTPFPNTWWHDNRPHGAAEVTPVSNLSEAGTSPDTIAPDHLAKQERDTMLYLAFLGITIVVVMLYIRRRFFRSS